MHCEYCNTRISVDAIFCNNCGSEILARSSNEKSDERSRKVDNENPKKSKTTAQKVGTICIVIIAIIFFAWLRWLL